MCGRDLFLAEMPVDQPFSKMVLWAGSGLVPVCGLKELWGLHISVLEGGFSFSFLVVKLPCLGLWSPKKLILRSR